MNVNDILSTLTHVPTDWILLGAAAAFAAFDALRGGTSRAGGIAIALLVTPLVVAAFKTAAFVGPLMQEFSTPVLQAALFGFVFVVTYLGLRRLTIGYGDGGGKPLQALLSGIAIAIMLAVVWVATPELQTVWKFGTQAQDVFGDAYRLWWLVCAFAALSVARG